MTISLNKLQRLLSTQRVTILVIGAALVSRLIDLIYFYTIGFDASYQVIAMHNFVTGHGITISKAIAADLGTTIYEPLINWPPGYSLLLTPFYLLFGHHYIAAGLTLDIIAAIVLIFTSRAILRALKTPLHFINLFTLFSGFYIYRFYLIASSDAIAVAFFLLAIYFTLRLFNNPQKWRATAIWLTGCLFLCSTLKYLFVPVVFVLPALLIIFGIIDKERAWKKAGLFCFLLLAVIIGGLLLWQHSLSGSIGYVSAPGRGFFPAHLLTAYPFIPDAFLQVGTAGRLAGLPSDTGTPMYRFFQVIHIALFLSILVYTLRTVARNKLRGLSTSYRFYYAVFLLCLATTAVLAVLSIRVEKEEIMPGYFWTYIEELRYYGLATILLHIGLFVLYTHYRPSFQWPRYVWGGLLVLLLLPELCRGIIFDARRIMLRHKEEYTWQYEYRFQQYTDQIIQDALRGRPDGPVVVTGSSHYMNNRVAVYNHAAVLTDNMVVNDLDSVKTSQPVLLVVILAKSQFAAFQPFISRHSNELAGSFDGFYFYTVYVTPR